MARLITCGFETGQRLELVSAQGLTSRVYNGKANVTTSKSKDGDYSLACLSIQRANISVKSYGKPARFFWKFDFLYIEVDGHTKRVIWEDNANGVSTVSHASISLNDSGQLVYTGDSYNYDAILATGTHVLTPNQWYEININYNGGSTSAGELIVDVDGERDITLTGIDTNNFTHPIANWMLGDAGSGDDYYFDNVFLNDTAVKNDASDYPDRLNIVAIPHGNFLQFLLPSGEGSSLQWTPAPAASGSIHYLDVNQIPVAIGSPGSDIARITTSTLNNTDLFDVENLPSNSGIRQVHVFSTSAHASTARHKRMVYVNGANYVSQYDSNSISNNLSLRNDLWYVNPDDNKLWEKSDIDSLQIGVKLTTANGSNLNTVGDMNLYVEHYIKPSASLDFFIEGLAPSLGQLFISDYDSITSSELDGSNPSKILQNGDDGMDTRGLSFLDIDLLNDKLIFMFNFPRRCGWCNLDGTSPELITLPTSIGNAAPSIAVDNSSNLVITDGGNTVIGPRIFVADYSNDLIATGNIVRKKDLTTGLFFTSIILTTVMAASSPLVVKYDSDSNLLFWTNKFGEIKRATPDLPATIITILRYTNFLSIAIDTIRKRIYYRDITPSPIPGRDPDLMITEANYSGASKRLLVSEATETFFGLAFDNSLENLYFLISDPVDNLYFGNAGGLDYNNSFGGATTIMGADDGLSYPLDVKVRLFTATPPQSIVKQLSLFLEGSVSGLRLMITPPIGGGGEMPFPDPDPPTFTLDLFLKVPEFIEQGMDLFIGSPPIDSYIGLYIGGPIGFERPITFFITAERDISRSCDLSIKAPEYVSENIDLYVSSAPQEIRDLDLFVYGIDSKSKDMPFFIFGHEDNPIYSINSLKDLFTQGFNTSSNNMDLFILNKEAIIYELDLFIRGRDLSTNQIDLFLKTVQPDGKDIDLFINGGDTSLSRTLDLFTQGLQTSDVSDNIPLITKGSFAPSGFVCPALDPFASIQISDELIQIYQGRIDSLINQLGKNVLLIFDPIIESCTNCLFDISGNRSTGIYKVGGSIPFPRGQKCPYCKGAGFLERENSRCIKCLIKWAPRELFNYGVSVSKNDGVVRLKTFLTDAPDIIRAKEAIIDHDIKKTFKLRVRLIKGPTPVGLRQDRYAVSYWQLFDL